MVAVRNRDERAVMGARKTLRGQFPSGFEWVQSLKPSHLIQFTTELTEAMGRMGITGDNSEVIELLDAWQATSELDADPEDAADLLRPREEKEYVGWSPKY